MYKFSLELIKILKVFFLEQWKLPREETVMGSVKRKQKCTFNAPFVVGMVVKRCYILMSSWTVTYDVTGPIKCLLVIQFAY